MKAALVAGVLAWSAPAAAGPLARWEPHIAEASAKFGVPAEWIRRVMRAESGGRTTLAGRPIVSRAGAMGLMQLMPGTWRAMRGRYRLGHDPHDPLDNILAGTAYLKIMHERFGYPGLFAAYNAGPTRYARHLATGRPLPSETVAYMAAVTDISVPGTAASERPSVAPLFAVRADAGTLRPAPGDGSAAEAGARLFVPLGRTPRR